MYSIKQLCHALKGLEKGKYVEYIMKNPEKRSNGQS